MKAPDISVILPVFNVEQYLSICLDSLREQKFENFEIIIVNDCSPDKSSEIISHFISNNPSIKIKIITHNKNKGLSVARNSGIKQATGKYLYFLDSDDDLTPNCLDSLYNAAEENNYPDIIVGENLIIEQEKTGEVRVKLPNGNYHQPDILQAYCNRLWYNQVWNKLYKREFIIKHKLHFAEGKILEDELWSFQVAALTERMAIKKVFCYNYYIRPKSIISSVNGSLKRWQSFYEINKLIRDFIVENNLQKNKYVQKYYLENLLVTLGGYNQCKELSYRIFSDIIKLNISSVHKLNRAGLLTRNESIAYGYVNLPLPFSYLYYRLVKLFLSSKKR